MPRSSGEYNGAAPSSKIATNHLQRPNVKRIVISSSLASVNQFSDPPETFYDDRSWNEESLRVVEELGDKANPRDMYCASKTLAERGM